MPNKNQSESGIILFAKQPSITSFSSLFTIKHALKTKKVGHTGTLDSFASGLLVVCIGSLTHLSSYITNFNKTYNAVIEFGSETDTLEYTGNITKKAPLPKKQEVISAIEHFKGEIFQAPPIFSAVHINGERASDIVRSGREVKIPSRKVTVFSAKIEEYLFEKDDLVKAVRIIFEVSKGTYIRSLARDIGNKCGSAAHLIGLRRIAVGNLKLENAIGANLLSEFTIKDVYDFILNNDIQINNLTKDILLENEIKNNLLKMTEELAIICGLEVVHIFAQFENDFLNGRFLHYTMFDKKIYSEKIAVFSSSNRFLGMIKKSEQEKLSYLFVLN